MTSAKISGQHSPQHIARRRGALTASEDASCSGCLIDRLPVNKC